MHNHLATILEPPPCITTPSHYHDCRPLIEEGIRHEVMVIEPEGLLRNVLSEYLTLEGYDPYTFSSMEQAIHSDYFDWVRVFLRTRPVCILLDFPCQRDEQEQFTSRLMSVFVPLHIPLLLMSSLPYPDFRTALSRWDLSHLPTVEKTEGVAHIVEQLHRLSSSSVVGTNHTRPRVLTTKTSPT